MGKVIDKSQINEEVWNKLGIQRGKPIALRTKRGIIKFPTITGRITAWVCCYCHETVYVDPIYTRAELEGTVAEMAEEDDVPFCLFLDGEGKERKTGLELTFHINCGRELGFL